MDYCIIGKHGFIGSALAKKLGRVSSYPTKDTKVIFYMAGVTHMDYDQNQEYHFNKVMQDFMFLLPFCEQHNIKFVYCSSALVYEKDNPFANCKRIMETMAQMYPFTLGLRIFPVYGPGEKRTVISKWCEDIKNDRTPLVFGDGTQKRDFIFIDDVVDQMLGLVEKGKFGIADIGAGDPVSFNGIIAEINHVLGKDVKAEYVNQPADYSSGIYCTNPLPVKTSLKDGIKRILEQ